MAMQKLAFAPPYVAGALVRDDTITAPPPDEETGATLLPVECWCRKSIVLVPRSEVVRGVTRECGRRDC